MSSTYWNIYCKRRPRRYIGIKNPSRTWKKCDSMYKTLQKMTTVDTYDSFNTAFVSWELHNYWYEYDFEGNFIPNGYSSKVNSLNLRQSYRCLINKIKFNESDYREHLYETYYDSLAYLSFNYNIWKKCFPNSINKLREMVDTYNPFEVYNIKDNCYIYDFVNNTLYKEKSGYKLEDVGLHTEPSLNKYYTFVFRRNYNCSSTFCFLKNKMRSLNYDYRRINMDIITMADSDVNVSLKFYHSDKLDKSTYIISQIERHKLPVFLTMLDMEEGDSIHNAEKFLKIEGKLLANEVN